jgi:hypothetical protein
MGSMTDTDLGGYDELRLQFDAGYVEPSLKSGGCNYGGNDDPGWREPVMGRNQIK